MDGTVPLLGAMGKTPTNDAKCGEGGSRTGFLAGLLSVLEVFPVDEKKEIPFDRRILR